MKANDGHWLTPQLDRQCSIGCAECFTNTMRGLLHLGKARRQDDANRTLVHPGEVVRTPTVKIGFFKWTQCEQLGNLLPVDVLLLVYKRSIGFPTGGSHVKDMRLSAFGADLHRLMLTFEALWWPKTLHGQLGFPLMYRTLQALELRFKVGRWCQFIS